MSTAGQLYVAFLNGRAHQERPELLTPINDVFMCRMTQSEAGVMQIVVERDQVGLQFLKGGDSLYVTVSWSPTGRPEDAKMRAVGKVDTVPNELDGPTMTLTASCGLYHLKEMAIGFCKKELADAPFYDPKFSDANPDDVESYLRTRCGFLHVHPVTWNISLSDYLVGRRLVDLSGQALFEEGRIRSTFAAEASPAASVKIRMTVDWTRSSDGSVNVAGRFGQFYSLDPNLPQSIAGRIRFIGENGGRGWTIGQNVLVNSRQDKTSYKTIQGVNRYRVRSRVDDVVSDTTVNGRVSLAMYQINPKRIPLEFSFREDRREVVEVVVDVPMQAHGFVNGFAEEEEEILEVSLRDIFEDVTTQVWTAGVVYEKGDLVVWNGKVWRAREAHEATDFYQSSSEFDIEYVSGGGTQIPYRAYRPMWVEVTVDDSVFTQMSWSYLRTDEAVARVQHMVLRAASEGRKRLRAMTVEMVLPFEVGIDLSVADSVRFERMRPDGTYQSCVGKVIFTDAVWDGAEEPYVIVRVGVSIGTADKTGASSYFRERYTKAPYTTGQDRIGNVRAQNLGGIAAEVRANGGQYDPSGFDPTRLGDPSYAVINSGTRGGAFSQGNAASAIAAAGGDVRKCTSVMPTTLLLYMRDLPMNEGQEEPLTHKFTVRAKVTDSPKGVDFDGDDV